MKEYWNSLSPKKQKIIQVFAIVLAMGILAILLSHGVNAPAGFNE